MKEKIQRRFTKSDLHEALIFVERKQAKCRQLWSRVTKTAGSCHHKTRGYSLFRYVCQGSVFQKHIDSFTLNIIFLSLLSTIFCWVGELIQETKLFCDLKGNCFPFNFFFFNRAGLSLCAQFPLARCFLRERLMIGRKILRT